MRRSERPRTSRSFVDAEAFDEQVRRAVARSPWWMASIAAHVVLYVISALLAQPPVRSEEAEAPRLTLSPAAEPPLEQDAKPTEWEMEYLLALDPDPLRPTIKDADLSDHNEMATNDLVEESWGEGGLSDAPFEGPANNAIVSIAPSLGDGSAFKGRGGHRRLYSSCGGRKETDDAVERALKWLAGHQSPDGRWECAGFDQWRDGKPAIGPRPTGLGKATYDPGVTGLALLAFLGAGYTNRGDHPFAKTVQGGLRYLKSIQDPEGCFGPRVPEHFVYNHAIAALAMVEAYGMTGSAIYKGPAQKALDFIALARNRHGGWRYGVKPGENDSSVTGWMMMALKSAMWINASEVKAGKRAPLQIDGDAFDGIRAWVEGMTDPATGRAGYVQRGSGAARPAERIDEFPASKSESMTAVAMLARVFLGEDPRRSEPIRKGAALCAQRVPAWNPRDGSIDMYYWYYGSLAVFQVGGEPWRKWNDAMRLAIAGSQRDDTDYGMYQGSWDPIDPWGQDGGRVYSTATMAMCLEVYYRYDRVFGVRGPEDDRGR